MKVIAQSLNIGNGTGAQTITGPLQGITTIGDVISKVLLFLFPAAGLILLFVLIWGGFDFITSQGSPEKIKSAWAKITTGIIGFVMLVFSFLIVRLISYIFGLDTGII